MEILLHYLVEETAVSRNDLMDYYVEERGASPQVDVFGSCKESSKSLCPTVC